MEPWTKDRNGQGSGKGFVFSHAGSAPELSSWVVEEGHGPYHADGEASLRAERGEEGLEVIAYFEILPGGVVDVNADEEDRGDLEALITRINPELTGQNDEWRLS
jgi:hypothetical protein